MLAEHDTGREFIKQMTEASAEKILNKDKFIKSSRGYINLLRAHIEKENKVLFPMGDLKLSEMKQKELLEAFEDFEEKVIGKGKHEELHKQLDSFNIKYLK
jgi:hemerythrin-like domain-containing protein